MIILKRTDKTFQQSFSNSTDINERMPNKQAIQNSGLLCKLSNKKTRKKNIERQIARFDIKILNIDLKNKNIIPHPKTKPFSTIKVENVE